MPEPQTISKKVYYGFALWYLMFFLSAVSGVGYAFVSMHWLESIPRFWAVAIALVVLVCAIYIFAKSTKLARIFVGFIIIDIFSSFSLASKHEYGAYFGENISSILSNENIIGYYMRHFSLKIIDMAYSFHFYLCILIIALVSSAFDPFTLPHWDYKKDE